jgi:hypothetical protein
MSILSECTFTVLAFTKESSHVELQANHKSEVRCYLSFIICISLQGFNSCKPGDLLAYSASHSRNLEELGKLASCGKKKEDWEGVQKDTEGRGEGEDIFTLEIFCCLLCFHLISFRSFPGYLLTKKAQL